VVEGDLVEQRVPHGARYVFGKYVSVVHRSDVIVFVLFFMDQKVPVTADSKTILNQSIKPFSLLGQNLQNLTTRFNQIFY
jgi:hypothetical protein